MNEIHMCHYGAEILTPSHTNKIFRSNVAFLPLIFVITYEWCIVSEYLHHKLLQKITFGILQIGQLFPEIHAKLFIRNTFIRNALGLLKNKKK